MIGAEVEHVRKGRERAGAEAPPALGSAVEGLPGGLLRPGISPQRGAGSEPAQLLGWRIRILGLTEAVAPEQEDLGVLDEAVGDRRGDGRIEEYVAPVGERCVGGDDGGTLLAVADGDNLIEEVRRLLVEGQISKFVTNEESRFGIGLELADEGVIDL